MAKRLSTGNSIASFFYDLLLFKLNSNDRREKLRSKTSTLPTQSPLLHTTHTLTMWVSIASEMILKRK
jgi:hypothetical protein